MRPFRLLVFVLFFAATLPASAQLALDGADAAVSLAPLANTLSAEGQVALYAGATPGVPYTGITLQGRTTDHDLTGEVRFEQADGTWTGWQPLYLIFLTSAGEDFVGSYRGDAVWQGRLEIRLRSAVGQPVSLMYNKIRISTANSPKKMNTMTSPRPR